MNIHCTHSDINGLTFGKFVVGSKLYGLDTDLSDVDYLCIYQPNKSEVISPFRNNYQLQVKEDGIDFIYVSLQSFILNCLSGDSTINFELLHSDELKNSPSLSWLYECRSFFYNYKLLRAYLGFARRDLKYMHVKPHKHDILTDHYSNKKLIHAYRSYYYALNLRTAILSGRQFSLKFPDNGSKFLMDIYNIDSQKERNKLARKLTTQVSELRHLLNSEHGKGYYTTYMTQDHQKTIDNHVSAMYGLEPNVLDKIYESNELGEVKYY